MCGEDVLFFDDLDDFLEDDTSSSLEGDGGVEQQDLVESVEYFRRLFSDEILAEDEIHSAAAAIILYQHLNNMGYVTTIDAGDTSTSVCVTGGEEDELLSHVQYLLESISSLKKSNRLSDHKGSTIRSINLNFLPHSVTVVIRFISV